MVRGRGEYHTRMIRTTSVQRPQQCVVSALKPRRVIALLIGAGLALDAGLIAAYA